MKSKNVQQRNARFVWRLNLLGSVLRNVDSNECEQTYTTPGRAGYEADLVKHYVREKYGLRSAKTEMSLPVDKFEWYAKTDGLDLADLEAVFKAMPWSAREFCLDSGALLRQEAERLAAVPTGESYLNTLLFSLPKRVSEAVSVVTKAKQLTTLTEGQRTALTVLEYRLLQVESETRAESQRIATLR